MAKKKIIRNETIIKSSMVEVMHDSMMPYAEYVVMERALPRVEDGLKPVQRRILYTMRELSNTPDKPHKKSARITGDTMGKYHPHGDTSIYEAMVRMAQPFSVREMLVDGHGNFGSIDGDRAAAMRYTEVRMAPLALEMLRDIEKDTVPFSYNFDDTLKEPDMLPGRYPNLLVNGAMGIAVGLATNMAPHNLGEVIDGVCAQIDNPNITTEGLMEHIKGPDFPTGGYIIGSDGIKDAYEKGKGRVIMRAKATIEKANAGKQNIVITEIPYQVNKASMLEKILKTTLSKKGILTGISDIRDESDREGMRAVIEVKKDADANKILQYLYKYSDLQSSFNVNAVAIADGKPRLLNLKEIIAYYIKHQVEVVTRRTRYDLERAEAREHILLGLKIAIENIDEVIAIIKKSPSPNEAKRRLMQRFELTGLQAQAILDMRLARLTALEVEKVETELAELKKLITKLKSILRSKAKLMNVIKKELEEIKKRYNNARRTRIVKSEDKQLPSAEDFVLVEDVYVSLTRDGYIKQMAEKTYIRSQRETLIDDLANMDVPILLTKTTTAHYLLIFTSIGNAYRLPCQEIVAGKWSAKGNHLSTLIHGFDVEERIVGTLLYNKLPTVGKIMFITKHGMAKSTEIEEFDVRNKKVVACGLKSGDAVVSVNLVKRGENILLITKKGMSLCMRQAQISAMGRAAKGVKAMTLSPDDEILFAQPLNEEGEVMIVTETGYAKRVLALDYIPQNRGGKGVRTMNFTGSGSNGSRIIGVVYITLAKDLVFELKNKEIARINSEEISIQTPFSKGKPYVNAVMGNDVVKCYMHLD
ncbi:MAG: DNA gyrase subunit A [Clostridiales bacterium]|nr:DNA gyrase subunit A [Clostridiales bacterium]